MKNRHQSLILSFLFLLAGCYKDVDNSLPQEVILEIPEVIVTTTLSGHLSDLEGGVMDDYSLLINGIEYEVAGSYFSIKIEGLNKRGQTVFAYKNDKIIALGTFLPIENDINRIELTVFPEWESQVINPRQNTDIAVGMAVRLDISDTYFKNDNGGDYEGELHVESGLFSDLNRPTVLGFDAYGVLNTLEVKGGFYVGIKDKEEAPLKVDEKHRIKLVIDNIPSESNSLYRFDEEEKAWIEIAKVEKGRIEVPIQKYGYFVLVHAERGIFLEGRCSRENNPIAYQRYNWDDGKMHGEGISTTGGRWLTVAPAQSNVVMRTANPCGNQLELKTITTKKEHIEDVVLALDEANGIYQFLKVSVLDCEGNPSSKPSIYLKTSDDNSDIYTFPNGEINVWMAVCPTFRLTAYDIDSGMEGPLLEWSTSIDDDLSYLTSCGSNANGYTVLKIRGEQKLFPAFELEETGERSILKATDNTVRLSIKNAGVGTFEADKINIFINDASFGDKGYYIDCENAAGGCGIEDCKITHYSVDADGWIRVSFSGTLWMRTIEPLEAGYFAVEGVILLKG